VAALDELIATTKKKKLAALALELRQELGPVDVETGAVAAKNAMEEARARVGEEAIAALESALVGAGGLAQAREIVAAHTSTPEALMLALVKLVTADPHGESLPFGFEPGETLLQLARDHADLPMVPWAIAAWLASTPKANGRKRSATEALASAGRILGEALRPAVVASLMTREVVYPEIYFEWLAESPSDESAPLFVKGLSLSKTVCALSQRGLLALGEAGAVAAAEALTSKKKGARLAAAEVLAQHPTAALAEPIRAQLSKEKDQAVRAKLDAALGALSADLI
jgi:hypothetical protein